MKVKNKKIGFFNTFIFVIMCIILYFRLNYIVNNGNIKLYFTIIFTSSILYFYNKFTKNMSK